VEVDHPLGFRKSVSSSSAGTSGCGTWKPVCWRIPVKRLVRSDRNPTRTSVRPDELLAFERGIRALLFSSVVPRPSKALGLGIAAAYLEA
jgi:hypothetical protein